MDQQMVLEKMDMCIQKLNLDTDLPLPKINPKQITNLNVECKTIKLLEDNVREDLDDLKYSDNFLYTIPMAQPMKEIIYKLDFIKIEASIL